MHGRCTNGGQVNRPKLDVSYGLITLEIVSLKSFTLRINIFYCSRTILFAKPPTASTAEQHEVSTGSLPYPSSVGTFVMASVRPLTFL